MRTFGLWTALITAVAMVGCSESDQRNAQAQAERTRQEASKDLHKAAGDARQGFHEANRAVTDALESARQSAQDAIHDANRRRDHDADRPGGSDQH
ncbi:MAG TPA: hypothetical protein VF146_17525 [Bryobacteraceae bacterium]